MTPDLTYLAYSALLLGVLWIPYFVGQTMANGFLTPQNYRDPTMPHAPLWVQRANRAQINLVQAFPPFAVLVLVAHVTGQSNTMTAFWCMVFFWARLAHAVVYLLGIAYIRTVVFLIGFAALIGVFWEVVT